MQNVPDEGHEIELFETGRKTSPSTKDEPVKENANFFTLIKNWFRPRTA
jgi:hypothetical protein